MIGTASYIAIPAADTIFIYYYIYIVGFTAKAAGWLPSFLPGRSWIDKRCQVCWAELSPAEEGSKMEDRGIFFHILWSALILHERFVIPDHFF